MSKVIHIDDSLRPAFAKVLLLDATFAGGTLSVGSVGTRLYSPFLFLLLPPVVLAALLLLRVALTWFCIIGPFATGKLFVTTSFVFGVLDIRGSVTDDGGDDTAVGDRGVSVLGDLGSDGTDDADGDRCEFGIEAVDDDDGDRGAAFVGDLDDETVDDDDKDLTLHGGDVFVGNVGRPTGEFAADGL